MKLLKKVLAVLAVLTLVIAALPRGASAAADIIDFEDEKFDYIHMAENEGDPAILTVVDLNGSKMLKIDTQEKDTPRVIFEVSKLVGSSVIDAVRTIEFDLYIEQPSGESVAWNGGAIGSYGGADGSVWTQCDWTFQDDETKLTEVIKMTRTFEVGQGFVNDTTGMFLFMNIANNGTDMYIDNVRFLTADGSAIALVSTTQRPGSNVSGNTAMDVTAVMEVVTKDVPMTGSTSNAIYYLVGIAAMLKVAVFLKKRETFEVK
ncbi:MAG: hypothetical protein K0S47_867 [Herbinix sp.]|jgi:hypothetical protein|nr:hypothetical protein [Herbinix sp.]